MNPKIITKQKNTGQHLIGCKISSGIFVKNRYVPLFGELFIGGYFFFSIACT